MKAPFQDRYPELVTPPPSFAEVSRALQGVGWTWSWTVDLAPQPAGSDADWRLPYDVPVEIGHDGESVISGEVALARALVDATLARNVRLVEAEIREWIASSRHVDDDERVWQRRWEAQLDEAPGIRYALEFSKTALMKRAGLTEQQQAALNLQLEGEGPLQIAREMGTSESTARRWLQESMDRLRELRPKVAEAVA